MNKRPNENERQEEKSRKSIWDKKIILGFSLGELAVGLLVLLVLFIILYGYDYFTTHAPVWAERGTLIPILLVLGGGLFGVFAISLRGKALLYAGVIILYVIAVVALIYYFDAIRHSLKLKLGSVGAVLVLLGLGVGAKQIAKRWL